MLRNRKSCRSGERCEVHSWGEALYCAVHHSEPTAKEIAEALGVRFAYLLDAANPDRDEHQFQARWLVPLMHASGNLAPLHYLAHALGGVFVDLPRVSHDHHQDVRTAFVRVMQELGDDARVIELALLDETITPDEASRIDAEIDESIEALLKVKATVRAKVSELPTLRAIGSRR